MSHIIGELKGKNVMVAFDDRASHTMHLRMPFLMKEYEESINEPKLIFEMRSFVIFGHLRSAELDAIC